MNQADQLQIAAAFPVAFQDLFRPARYKAFYGGRGKGVSWAFARALLIKAVEAPLRILCTRELQNSIKDSVHRLLSDQIILLGLRDMYTVTQSEIRSAMESTFIFEGLRYNVEEIRSMEGIDICWVEQAEKMSDTSWKILAPTIRKPGSEIWVSWNPDQESDPTHQRLIVNTPPDTILRKVSYRDNPWFPEELQKEMEYDRRVDPEAAAWVWDGEFNKKNNAAVMHGKWRVDVFDTPTDADGPYQGADWGFSQDPTVLTRSWIKGKKLLIEYESYAVGCEIEDTPDLFDRIPMARNYKIRADSARPETVSHVKKKGFRIEGVEKWKGSVEDGVAFLRSFEEIIIHERCVHTAQEARLYSHKVDRLTQDVQPEIVDKHNHCWDSIRYGLAPLIRISKSKGRPSVRSL